ncbi:hypothetical protein FRC01_008298 [Tulasnella sp. 417]|nr:hypothetical protein FRC01_008298 [Tulasnella sp. 417]
MDNATETLNTDILFRGIDGNECEAFVVAIRYLACAKGKDEDPNWMLRYATTGLRGKALRWHAKLDPSIRKDWDLFVQALFEAYPFVEEGCEAEIATPVWSSTTFSPARSITIVAGNDRPQAPAQPAGTKAVPSPIAQPSRELSKPVPLARAYDPSLPGCQMGRLLVVYEEGRWGPHYISASQSVTSNVHEALIVTFIPSSGVHQIARDYNIPSEDYYSTATVYVDISGQSISFVKDSDTPKTTHPTSELQIMRARIVFEPIR